MKISAVESQKALKLSELEQTSMKMSNTASDEMRRKIDIEKLNLKEDNEKHQCQIDDINKEIQELNIAAGQFASTITFIERENEKLELDSGLTFCPTCKRDMNEDCRKQLNDMMLTNLKEIEKAQNEMKSLKVEVDKKTKDVVWWKEAIQKNLNDYNETIKNLQEANRLSISQFVERKNTATGKVMLMMQNAVNQIQKENEEERFKIGKEIGEFDKELSKLKELQKEVDLYNTQLRDFQKEKEDYKQLIDQTNESKFDKTLIENCVIGINNAKKEMESIIEERSTYDKKIRMINFWKTGFSASGIQSMLIDEAIPFMNKRIGHYMELLCGGRYKVTFDTLKATKDAKEFRDKISVNVFDTQTHSDARVKFSGGQTRLVDIGTILTLADLQANVQDVSVNIILFDEIFDALDDENIRYASNLLRLASKDKWVGIISHRHIDSIEADNVLEFR